MTVLNRPTVGEIDAVVESVLRDLAAMDFPELERTVKSRLPQVSDPILVRQSAWRLINRNRAKVLPGMKVELIEK